MTSVRNAVPGLKEWSAAIHGLLGGRQTVLLRKGGVGEKRFVLEANDFLLFPTVAHSHADRVRPECRDLLAAAEGDSTETQITIRAAAKVVATVEVRRPERLPEIEDLHIWTDASVREDRLEFRPRHLLTALIVQVSPLLEPIQRDRGPWCSGCTSWVNIPMTPPFAIDLGGPVRDGDYLAGIARRVEHTVG